MTCLTKTCLQRLAPPRCSCMPLTCNNIVYLHHLPAITLFYYNTYLHHMTYMFRLLTTTWFTCNTDLQQHIYIHYKYLDYHGYFASLTCNTSCTMLVYLHHLLALRWFMSITMTCTQTVNLYHKYLLYHGLYQPDC